MAEQDEFNSQHFLKEIEQAIQVANREILSQCLPPITKENIMPLALSVARQRGQYLAEAFRIAETDGGEPPSEEEIETLRRNRELYEEARESFEALTHVIERGYVELGD